MEQWMYWLGSLGLAFATFLICRFDNAKKQGGTDATLSVNVQYIKESVDKMTLEQKDLNRKLEKQADDNTEIKVQLESALSSLSSLHKRVDRAESRIDKIQEANHDW